MRIGSAHDGTREKCTGTLLGVDALAYAWTAQGVVSCILSRDGVRLHGVCDRDTPLL